MPEPEPPVPNPRPGLPEVSGYVRWPELVKIMLASVLAGGLTTEGIATLLHSLANQMDLWYIGPEGATLKIVFSGLVTIVVGLISGYRLARAGESPDVFTRVERKFSDDAY